MRHFLFKSICVYQMHKLINAQWKQAKASIIDYICFIKLTSVFRTPHESLKLTRKTVRQFFRVVTSEVNQFTT